MKLAVIGSRGLSVHIDRFVENLEQIDLIISGGAQGMDTMAEYYARENGIPVRIIRPNYNQFGRGAPLIRDREIVDASDMVLAVWDGKSRGTAYTVNYAHRANKPVRLFRYTGGDASEQKN